ncbi:MAG: acetylxylan esterase [Candidatus Margulisbacteria bacterium]|jgi:cephalosporin-C deacetylase-like acetyl esterase|nr:acetylxylan esterase [Candidatus Margulisiibacteriota bacterium]
MHHLRAALVLVLFLSSAVGAVDQEALKQLWDVPTNEVNFQLLRSYQKPGVKVQEIYYYSRSYNRQPVRIFGYYCQPLKTKAKLPAILLSHGGGGSASLIKSAEWARRGYAVLSIDLPGKGEQRQGSRSTGPNMDVVNLLCTQPDPSYNYLVHAVAAARYGITFLATRPEVDPDRIGMIGLSWGGVLTLLTNGQDKRLKAAVNIFGAGFIPEGCTWQDWFSQMPAEEKQRWNDYLDPKNFLPTQHAPILFVTGTNDHCYYLTTFQKSFEHVPGEKAYYLIPNLRHRFLASSSDPALAWFDLKLKNARADFPAIELLTPIHKGESRVIIPVKVNSRAGVKSVRLYYALGGPQQWTAKRWLEVIPHEERGVYYFGLPAARLKPDILYFASVVDRSGGVASTLVRSLINVKLEDGNKTFAVSSPIKTLYRNEPPFTLLNGLVIPGIRFQLIKSEQVYRAYTI